MVFRQAVEKDALAIADLHARSWQLHYRGSFSDAYLDGPVLKDRQRVWTKRMIDPTGNQYCLVAEVADQVIGLLCLYAGDHPLYGSLIDNLHVAPEYQHSGVGRQLMELGRTWLAKNTPGVPYYLWVLAANEKAIRFYERMGGQKIEEAWLTNPDASTAHCYRYGWPPELIPLGESE